MRGSGVQVTGRATAHLTDCDVHRTTGDGVTLDTDAVLTLADCRIHDIPENAVDLRSRSVLTLTRTTVRQFGRNGLSVWDPGTRVDANQCEIFDSTGDYPAVWISDGATAVLDSLPGARRAGRAVRPGSRFARGRRRQRPVPGAQHGGLGERRCHRAARRLPHPGRGHGRLVPRPRQRRHPEQLHPGRQPHRRDRHQGRRPHHRALHGRLPLGGGRLRVGRRPRQLPRLPGDRQRRLRLPRDRRLPYDAAEVPYGAVRARRVRVRGRWPGHGVRLRSARRGLHQRRERRSDAALRPRSPSCRR